MTADIWWTKRARDDLRLAYVAIGRANPDAAERFFDRTEAKIALLRTSPCMGTPRPDFAPGLRMVVEWPFVILYRAIPDDDETPAATVEIVRVVDGRRDLPSLFS